MSFETEIKKLYQEVNTRNQSFLDKYANTEYSKYHIYKITASEMLGIDEQNEQYIAKFQEIANKYSQSIDIPRGFKNRLFLCSYRENILVRINIEVGKSSSLMSYDEIKEWIKDMAKVVQEGYEINPKQEIEKLEQLHGQMQKEKYRVHIYSGKSQRATIRDIQSLVIVNRINIPKLSGLLLLNKENVEIVEPIIRKRKPRKDRKKAILDIVIGKYSLSIIG